MVMGWTDGILKQRGREMQVLSILKSIVLVSIGSSVGILNASAFGQSGASSHTLQVAVVPTYADTVSYLQTKFKRAGYPTQSAELNGVVGGRIGVASILSSEPQYTLSVDACKSMTFASVVITHDKEWSEDDRSWHQEDTS
jgi:hypothetical protein